MPRMWKQFVGKLHRKSHKSDQESTRNPDLGPNKTSSSSSSSSSSSPSSLHSPSQKRASAAVFPASVVAGIETLLAFRDVPTSEKMNLFISKLSLCSVVFDFTDPAKDGREKELKRATLLELLDFVSQNPLKFTEPAIEASCEMCSMNLFRVFPPNKRSSITSTGEIENDDEPTFDLAWPHLQLVYEFLLKFVTSPSLEPRVAKKYLDHAFILKLINLFDSEDPRERDCLKAILHRIYGKFMVHRPFIRKGASNVFYSFVFETEKHNGIAELLEILGSVITGFALPLKEEHKTFLSRVLIPLHKPKSLGAYSKQLCYCVSQFIDKDPTLASIVVEGMLKCWPITNSQKEVIFLIELDDILEIIDRSEFRKVMAPLFSRLSRCMSSNHFQVAEKAMSLLNNEQIVDLIAQNRQVIFPILVPALECNTRNHWNRAVLSTTFNVRKTLSEMDQALFLSCVARDMVERIRREL